MINARRIGTDSLSKIFESFVSDRFVEPRISLRDGETRELSDPALRGHPHVPNRLLKHLQDVYVRAVQAGQDSVDCAELLDLLACPVTLETMQHPVVDPFGHHVDGPSLKRWIDAGHRRAPLRSQNYPGITVQVAVDRRILKLLKLLDVPVDADAQPLPESPWPLPAEQRAPEAESMGRSLATVDGAGAAREALSYGVTVGAGTLLFLSTPLGCWGAAVGAPLMVAAAGVYAKLDNGPQHLSAWLREQSALILGTLQGTVPYGH